MLLQSLVSITRIPLFVFDIKKFIQFYIDTFNVSNVNVYLYYKSKMREPIPENPESIQITYS